jgi:hypothetical protein
MRLQRREICLRTSVPLFIICHDATAAALYVDEMCNCSCCILKSANLHYYSFFFASKWYLKLTPR